MRCKTATESRSESPASSHEEDGQTSGIKHGRLDPDAARSHFDSSRVDASAANFSDRIDQQRESYQVSTRRRFNFDDVDEEDVDEDKKLERRYLLRRANRIAELVAELKNDIEVSKETGKWEDITQEQLDEHDDEAMKQLNETATWLHITDKGPDSATTRMRRRIDARPDRGPLQLRSEDESSFPTRLPDQKSSWNEISSPQAVALYTALCSRLERLETIMGLNSIPPPDLPSVKDFPMPLLPMASVMQRQLNLLTDVDEPFLDELGKRIRSLTTDAERLDERRREAKKNFEELRSTMDAASTSPITSQSNGYPLPATPRSPALSGTTRMPGTEPDIRAPTFDPNHPLTHPDLPAKISALYSTLPVIENLVPQLPPTLQRLHALRQVHQDVGSASVRMEELEEHEAGMQKDMRDWKAQLLRIEDHLKIKEDSWMTNMETIENWVKDLEGRIKALNEG